MSPERALIAASASILVLSLSGAAWAQQAPLPIGPAPIGSTDFYTGLSAFGSFEDFGALNDYSRGHNTSVLQRERPEYAALGIPVSSFLLYPRLSTGVGFSDNIYAVDTGKTSDEYEEFEPNITAQSTWSRNTLNIDAGGQFQLYDSKSSENETGGHIRAASQISFVGDSYGLIGGDVQHAFEPRTDGGSPVGAAAPAAYTTYGLYGRGVYQQSRIRGSLSVDFRGYNWDNVPATAGGIISEKFRNDTITTVAARGEFASTPDAAIFGQLAYTDTSYVKATGFPDRDSNEYQFRLGTDFDLTALIRGELGGGYVRREYAAATYGTLDGFAARGQVEYFPSPLTTFTVNVSRSIQDAVIPNSGGYFSNLVALRADHELLRNLLLNAALTYEYDTFKGINRHDAIGNFRIGFQYLLSRNIGLNANYVYSKRESRGPSTLLGPEFNANRLFIGLVLQR